MDDSILKLIQDVIYQVTGKNGITYDTDFVQDLGLNSFDVMNIICVFEERFGTDIPNRDVWQLRQVKDVIAYMKKRGFNEV